MKGTQGMLSKYLVFIVLVKALKWIFRCQNSTGHLLRVSLELLRQKKICISDNFLCFLEVFLRIFFLFFIKKIQ